jgi:MFS family permease
MTRPHRLGQRYAFVAAGVTFVALLMAAGLRAAPGVLMIPWQKAFGWDRGVISLAAAIGLFLYGLVGPFAAAIMQRFGVRRTVACAFVLMAAATGLSLLMTQPWQLIATWGVMSGLASGCVALVLAATVVNRWFVKNRGLMMGLLTASTSTGTLIFLPIFTAMTTAGGWKPVAIVIAVVAALMAPLALLFLPERPQDVGVEAWGAEPGVIVAVPASTGNPAKAAISALGRAVRKRDFWLLAGTFFVCGFTTNGLIGAHMISLCSDRGLAATTAGGLMAAMGVFDLVGTTGSGWLTDRYDPRKLLFMYYGLRGLSLIYLPFSDFSLFSLSLFALFYGLDWIATVPPTLRLANQAFGEREAPIVFGWIAAAHQLGAASAAFMAGSMRTLQGNYVDAFVISGSTAVIAAFAALMIGRGPKPPKPVLAAA